MKVNLIAAFLIIFLSPLIGSACSMYKITEKGKTIVGNNEDWLSPNSQFWFEPNETDRYGVLYMGLMDNFAQGAINEAGLVFDGFANPYLAIEQTVGKLEVPIAEAIRHIMQSMSRVEEVKAYLQTINLSDLTTSQVVFVDQSGTYLIVEGDELIVGDEQEKAFSNFYYTQITAVEEVEVAHFQRGLQFMNSSESHASLDYCAAVMQQMSNTDVFATQYSSIYDLTELKIRLYLFHDYSTYIELDLKEELKKAPYRIMMADLFAENTIGHQHYQKYNDEQEPSRFLKEVVQKSNKETEDATDWNGVINMIGYEWIKEKSNPAAAIKIFEYGTQIRPMDADLFDSLGEAYFLNKNYKKAKIAYEHSLSLDAENENAKDFLEKIAEQEGAKN